MKCFVMHTGKVVVGGMKCFSYYLIIYIIYIIYRGYFKADMITLNIAHVMVLCYGMLLPRHPFFNI